MADEYADGFAFVSMIRGAALRGQNCALCGLEIVGIPDTLDRGTLQPIHEECPGFDA